MRAAVIGCGRMGTRPQDQVKGTFPNGWLPVSHIEAVQESCCFDLVAACDVSKDALHFVSERYGVANLYQDFRELIDVEKPEVITIATRTPIKKEIIEYACQNAVKGIYVEKPISNDIQSCHEILSLVNRSGCTFLYGVNRRYHECYHRAKQLVNEGAIGDLINIAVDMGVGQLFWTHPHSVDLILFFLGSTRLNSIQAQLDTETLITDGMGNIESDPVVEFAQFKFDNGITGTITQRGGLNVILSGTKGNMTIHADGHFLEFYTSDERTCGYFLNQKTEHYFPKKGATVNAMELLAHSIQKNVLPPISLDEVDLGMKMLFGIAWSSLNYGRRISPDDVPNNFSVLGKYQELHA